MCGISGFISLNYKLSDLKKMGEALVHRGPDSEGFYYDPNDHIGLAHRRLSVIDTSSSANQPMVSHCSRFIMVYNGEIYNYKEIASELIGVRLKTHSDSEVILEAFAKWGEEFIHKLNGMFAICIYDKFKKKLFLFRDRMGIKPLFYYSKNNELIFSSEIKAIKKLNLNLSVSSKSIYSYLHLGYIPKNNSIFNEINNVPPGSYITFEKKKKIINYWKTEDLLEENVISDFKNAKFKLKDLLKKSVKKRLVSDVPIGTFLSGGTDSSLITSIAQEVNNESINTFSIGFKDSKYNESEHAKKVSMFLNTNHTEFIISEKDAINELEKILDHMDEPFADSSILPTMMVSKMARKHVTVCLSGDGGDEQFMGYGAYNWAERLKNPFFWKLRSPISEILNLCSRNQKKRAALVFNSPKLNWKSHIFSQEQYLFSEIEIEKLLNTNEGSKEIDEINNIPKLKRNLSAKEKQAYFDLNNYLIDDLLVKVDRSSMYSSLECRVPLLDHNIVKFSLNLDENLKTKNGVQKYLLKEILYDYIPKKIMDRPKWGFSIPLEKWLLNDLKYLTEKYLDEKTINEINILNSETVLSIKKRFYNGERYLYNRIWSLIVLVKFLKS